MAAQGQKNNDKVQPADQPWYFDECLGKERDRQLQNQIR